MYLTAAKGLFDVQYHYYIECAIESHHKLHVAADLLPTKVELHIFLGMPKLTQVKSIFAPLRGKTPEQIMAPAFADSHKMGYDKLYKLLLDHVGQREYNIMIIAILKVCGGPLLQRSCLGKYCMTVQLLLLWSGTRHKPSCVA